MNTSEPNRFRFDSLEETRLVVSGTDIHIRILGNIIQVMKVRKQLHRLSF